MGAAQRAMVLGVGFSILAAGACSSGGGESTTGTTNDGAAEGDVRGVNLNESADTGEPGGSLTYGLFAETDGWNPSTSRWAASGLQVAQSIFDTLAAYDAEGNWQPFLAESFTPNEDFTVWTVALRPDVVFHNGDPVDADAVAANLNYHRESLLTHAAFEPVTDVRSDGNLTVTVTMKDAWANWPQAMATQVGVVAEPDWLQTNDTQDPIGTGPFKMESWEPDKELVVTRNDDYWQRGLPYLDEIRFVPLADTRTRGAALDAGDVQIMLTADPDQIADYEERAADGDVQIVLGSQGETPEQFVQLNTSVEPFDDPDARRLLALATDQDALVETLFAGSVETADSPFSASSPWYTETDYPSYDAAAAQEAAAAYEAAHGGPLTFKLFSGPDTKDRELAQFLIQQWGEFGIQAELDTREQAEQIVSVITGAYQATLWVQFDSPHPMADGVWWHPTSVSPDPGGISLNFARNIDDEIGAALDAARGTPDRDVQKGYYDTVQERLSADLPYIWLYHEQSAVVAQPQIVNIVNWELPDGTPGLPLRQGSHPVFQIWLEGEDE